MTTYAIIYDTTTGIGYGSHAYGDSDPVLPSNEIACTQAQAQTPAAWTVVNGSLVQSLTYAKAAQSALIKQGFITATAAIPFTVNGTNYTLDTAQSKQAADMAIVVAANNALNHPVAWAASTAVNPNSVVQLSGGAFLFTAKGGTTGTTAPAAPTTFGTTVTDNTVTWELYGRDLEMSDGSYVTFGPQDIVSIFAQVDAYIHACKKQKIALIAQVNAQTAVPATYVTWSNP